MIFGIDIISSEALANEAVNIIDRVSDFKSYQLSNVDYKVKFCLDGEPFTVDFHTDDDSLITSSSCTCSADKCIHKTLALLLFKTSLLVVMQAPQWIIKEYFSIDIGKSWPE